MYRYQAGNMLRIRTSSGTSNYLQYTECGARTSAGIGDVYYSTCWQGGYFTLSATSATSAITGFYVSGKNSIVLCH